MVTDDLARVSQLILQQDGQKPVALDHLRAAAEALKQDERDRERGGEARDKALERSRDLGLGDGPSMRSMALGRQKTRERERDYGMGM